MATRILPRARKQRVVPFFGQMVGKCTPFSPLLLYFKEVKDYCDGNNTCTHEFYRGKLSVFTIYRPFGYRQKQRKVDSIPNLAVEAVYQPISLSQKIITTHS